MDLRGIDGVDEVPATGEEGSERRDPSPDVDQPATSPKVLHDQINRDRVLP